MHNIKRSLISIVLFSIMLISCNPGRNLVKDQTPTTVSTLIPTRTITPTPTKIITPTLASSATPTASPTTTPSFSLVKTSFEQSGKWNLSFPYSDPDLSGTFQATSDGYQLDPNFQVITIELSYQWWGLGDPVLDYQRIDRSGVDYWRGSTQISTKAVRDLIQSISHLHSQPQMLQSTTHTDDYPIWTIEIKNKNGISILLYSDSNTENYAPWNVIYNGQIYAQFDGQISNAISKLFRVMPGQPQASFWEGSSEEGYLTVESNGWPGQLSDGFNGLLALQNGFHYWTDPKKGELQGYVKGRSSINGTGNMIIGSITKLTNVEVDVENSQAVLCSMKSIESNDPAAFIWQFVCPVGQQDMIGSYRYPIRVTFSTDKDRIYTQSGELFGNWEQGMAIPLKQVPEEIATILNSSPSLRDLMTDHQLNVVNFQAVVDPLKGKMDHQWTATIVLLGQLKIDNRIVPYTATSNISIENSKLVQWSFDRNKLQALIKDTLSQAVTHRFLDGTPDLVLNLYYKETLDDTWFRRMYLWDCANIPVPNERVYPSEEQPFRGFAFNQSWDFGGAKVLLINGEPRLLSLGVHRSDPQDAIWVSMLPRELQPEDAPPFEYIDFYGWSPTLSIAWSENAGKADIDKYNVLAKDLPGQKEMRTWGFTTEPTALNINADGMLSLVDCEASK